MASRQRRSAGRVRTGGSPQRRVEHRSPVRAHAHGNGSARHMSRSPVASGARAHAAPGHPGLVPQPSHSSVMSATSAVTAGSVMSVPGHGGSTGGMRPHMVQAGGPHGMPGAMMHPGVPHPMASPMAPPGAAPNGGYVERALLVREPTCERAKLTANVPRAAEACTCVSSCECDLSTPTSGRGATTRSRTSRLTRKASRYAVSCP